MSRLQVILVVIFSLLAVIDHGFGKMSMKAFSEV